MVQGDGLQNRYSRVRIPLAPWIFTIANILVVEDDLDTSYVTKAVLEQAYFKVKNVNNGKQALDYLENTLPDLIVVDVMMPEMDGYTFCAKLESDARTRAIPVIVLTGKKKTKDMFETLSNVSAFIDKGSSNEKLLAAVKTALTKRPAGQEPEAFA